MSSFDYRSWIASLRSALSQLLAGFESRFGFEPDEHVVGPPALEGLLAEGRTSGKIPAVLLELYEHVGEIAFPDVHNGIFIHSLDRTVNGVQHDLPILAPDIAPGRIVVFGSDGGGAMFALDEVSGHVYFLPPGAVRDQVYSGGLEPPRAIASNLYDFLQMVLSAVDEFAVAGRTRSLP